MSIFRITKRRTVDPPAAAPSSDNATVASQPAKPTGPFRVRVWDNFHYMDDDEAYDHGSYATWEAALAEAKRVVEWSLDEARQGAGSAEAMYRTYTMFGDDPSICPVPEGMHFSAWDYARQRCDELAAMNRIAGAGQRRSCHGAGRPGR